LKGEPDVAPVEIAGDELTGEQIAGQIAHRLGVPTTFIEVPLDALSEDEDLQKIFGWLARPPSYQADFRRTRRLVPDLEDLSGWLGRHPGLDLEAGR
jgi:hypothetical protein